MVQRNLGIALQLNDSFGGVTISLASALPAEYRIVSICDNGWMDGWVVYSAPGFGCVGEVGLEITVKLRLYINIVRSNSGSGEITLGGESKGGNRRYVK